MSTAAAAASTCTSASTSSLPLPLPLLLASVKDKFCVAVMEDAAWWVVLGVVAMYFAMVLPAVTGIIADVVR